MTDVPDPQPPAPEASVDALEQRVRDGLADVGGTQWGESERSLSVIVFRLREAERERDEALTLFSEARGYKSLWEKRQRGTSEALLANYYDERQRAEAAERERDKNWREAHADCDWTQAVKRAEAAEVRVRELTRLLEEKGED